MSSFHSSGNCITPLYRTTPHRALYTQTPQRPFRTHRKSLNCSMPGHIVTAASAIFHTDIPRQVIQSRQKCSPSAFSSPDARYRYTTWHSEMAKQGKIFQTQELHDACYIFSMQNVIYGTCRLSFRNLTPSQRARRIMDLLSPVRLRPLITTAKSQIPLR